MIEINETEVVKDIKNKKLTVTREFNASLDQIWRTWTQSDLLDLWWAPDPCEAKTKFMDFREGGYWLYSITGPDDLHVWAKIEFTKIALHKRIESINSFCDQNGNVNSGLPVMNWKNEFSATSTGVKVIVEISFTDEADLEKIIEMGFERGFTTALRNLGVLLKRKSV
ncbi:MAG: hypothetical protein JWO44_208 [Bacteroidetes bacterium]|nr:hypothetical protein [Bacteroidota bacterium]